MNTTVEMQCPICDEEGGLLAELQLNGRLCDYTVDGPYNVRCVNGCKVDHNDDIEQSIIEQAVSDRIEDSRRGGW